MNSCKDCTHNQMCMWKRFIEEVKKMLEESVDRIIKEEYPEFPVKLDLISTCSLYSSPKKDLEPLHCQVQNVSIPNLVVSSSLQSLYHPYMPTCCCENYENVSSMIAKDQKKMQNNFINRIWDNIINKGDSK